MSHLWITAVYNNSMDEYVLVCTFAYEYVYLPMFSHVWMYECLCIVNEKKNWIIRGAVTTAITTATVVTATTTKATTKLPEITGSNVEEMWT